MTGSHELASGVIGDVVRVVFEKVDDLRQVADLRCVFICLPVAERD